MTGRELTQEDEETLYEEKRREEAEQADRAELEALYEDELANY